MFRIAKMWFKGFRPKDIEQFRQVYLLLNPKMGQEGEYKQFRFPSTQFFKPVVAAMKEIKEYLIF